MSGQPAVSARALVRSFALIWGLFLFGFGPGCGRESFDLLAPGAGGSPEAGQLNSGGVGGRSGSGGATAGLGPSLAGASGAAPNGGADAGLSCPPIAPSCKHCQNSGDCSRTNNSPFCDMRSHLCVECLDNNDCGNGVCDPLLGCEKPCQNSTDCLEAGHFCSRNVCVECRVNTDCPVIHNHQTACFSEFCVECFDDMSCPPDRPLCQAFRCVTAP